MLRNTKIPSIKILNEESGCAQQSMDLSRDLFSKATPSLLWYTFSNAITYGHFIDPSSFVNDKAQISLAKRPTGGGVTFHFGDLSFCIVVPHFHKLYHNTPQKTIHILSRTLQKALSSCTFQKISIFEGSTGSKSIPLCSMQKAYGDLLIDDKKFCGIAVRKNKQAVLFQVTLFLQPLPSILEEIMLPPFDFKVVEQQTTSLLCCKEKIKKAIVEQVMSL